MSRESTIVLTETESIILITCLLNYQLWSEDPVGHSKMVLDMVGPTMPQGPTLLKLIAKVKEAIGYDDLLARITEELKNEIPPNDRQPRNDN